MDDEVISVLTRQSEVQKQKAKFFFSSLGEVIERRFDSVDGEVRCSLQAGSGFMPFVSADDRSEVVAEQKAFCTFVAKLRRKVESVGSAGSAVDWMCALLYEKLRIERVEMLVENTNFTKLLISDRVVLCYYRKSGEADSYCSASTASSFFYLVARVVGFDAMPGRLLFFKTPRQLREFDQQKAKARRCRIAAEVREYVEKQLP